MDVSSAGVDLRTLIERIEKHGISDEDRALLRRWIPLARKCVEEIQLMCRTKVPSVDDAVSEMLEYGEWNPHREYVVTQLEQPELADALGAVRVWVLTGDKVKEWLDRDEIFRDRIAAIWLVEDDGTLTRKR